MGNGDPTTIYLKPVDHTDRVLELQIADTSTPGYLMEIASGKLQAHSTAAEGGFVANEAINNVAGGASVRIEVTRQVNSAAGVVDARGLILLENTARAATIDDDYVASETARYLEAIDGDPLYMWLTDGSAQITVAGVTLLTSHGDGELRVSGTTP